MLAIALVSAVIAPDLAQAQTFTVLHEFTGKPDGGTPVRGNLVRDAAGNLYGTTRSGGGFNFGTVFKVDATGQESVLYSFTGLLDGASPGSGLVSDPAGNLYGTTDYGGTFDDGTVFKLDVTGQETVLYNFTGEEDGEYPYGTLVRDRAGNLYGTTYNGGASDYGTVFKVDPSGYETVLYSFRGKGGKSPYTGLARDPAGNLYGTAEAGGDFRKGTLVKITPSGKFKLLYSFAGGSDGYDPKSTLIGDAEGNLYGTTYSGGASDVGTVFKLDATGKHTVLYTFSGGADGARPYGDLTRDAAGNLYGITRLGGSSNFGTVYKLDPAGTQTVLHNFSGPDGTYPHAGLIWDAAGNLYGTAFSGGAFDYGTVFKLTP
jgi:uncharacterized repeat protein (TIGR03803 family)